MGRDHSSVRKVFDYAEEQFLKDLPIEYIPTVTTTRVMSPPSRAFSSAGVQGELRAGSCPQPGENLDLLDEPLKKVVAYLEPTTTF